jgi:hypothetical protein
VCEFVAGLAAKTGVLDDLSWQGAVDEDRLAFLACNAPGFVVKGFDGRDGHGDSAKKREFYQSTTLEAMARELYTSWSDYRGALDRLLAVGASEVLIWDPDLVALQLDASTRIDALRRILASGGTVRVVVQDAHPLRTHHPRLLGLMTSFNHRMAVQQSGDSLASLRDAMVLADGSHGLIRFDRDNPRSKLLIAETEELSPYCKRFEDIWLEAGTPITATTTGL